VRHCADMLVDRNPFVYGMPTTVTRRTVLTSLVGLSVPAAASPAAFGQTSRIAGAPAHGSADIDAKRRKLRAAKSWGYQLKYWSPPRIPGPEFDVLVIDNAMLRFRDQPAPIASADLEISRKRASGPDRLVLAYMSIGEAESYRGYWQPEWNRAGQRPAWIGAENPAWTDNFPVEFWQPDWQQLIFGSPEAYLDQIVAQGFDGVYLDRVDVFEELVEKEPRAEMLMIEFVKRLSAYARQMSPSFLCVLQNAEELMRHREIRSSIDGIAKESLFFGIESNGAANPAETINGSIKYLKQAQTAGRPVFLVEYLTDPVKAAEARRRAKQLGFPIYFGPRELDFLTLAPPDAPGARPAASAPALDRKIPMP
jgi:cysteinyl-tRNA synthetase, unknown class